jgi:hypothetical protein
MTHIEQRLKDAIAVRQKLLLALHHARDKGFETAHLERAVDRWDTQISIYTNALKLN